MGKYLNDTREMKTPYNINRQTESGKIISGEYCLSIESNI